MTIMYHGARSRQSLVQLGQILLLVAVAGFLTDHLSLQIGFPHLALCPILHNHRNCSISMHSVNPPCHSHLCVQVSSISAGVVNMLCSFLASFNSASADWPVENGTDYIITGSRLEKAQLKFLAK